MAHYEPPHQDLCCLQIQLFASLVVKELIGIMPCSVQIFSVKLLLAIGVIVFASVAEKNILIVTQELVTVRKGITVGYLY